MELKGNFLPQFKVYETHFAPLPSTKHDSLLVVALFTREPFLTRHYRWKHLEIHCDNNEKRIEHLDLPKNEKSKLPELSFDRAPPTDQECTGTQRREFGHFVARKAILDEEYWTAAWLRAEAHWESLSYTRHVDSYKRKYAEAEFYALKRRCMGQEGKSSNCFCFVAVKKEDKHVRRTVLNSIVGTLDLSIRQFRQGETRSGAEMILELCNHDAVAASLYLPRDQYFNNHCEQNLAFHTHLPLVGCLNGSLCSLEHGKMKNLSSVLAGQEPFDTRKYAYIANVCVAKFARRRGIASNMLYLAADVATMAGLKQLFVHVNADNKPAEDLYKKIGFKVVEMASSPATEDEEILMSMEL